MDPNRNERGNNGPKKPEDNKNPKNGLWVKLMIAVAAVFIISSIYNMLGAVTTLSDIGVDEEKTEKILEYSPLVRNRLTLMRLRRATLGD